MQLGLRNYSIKKYTITTISLFSLNASLLLMFDEKVMFYVLFDVI